MSGMSSVRRKLAIATWSAPREGNIYGKLSLDVEPMLAYVKWLRQTSDERVTLTTVIGKAVATALAECPGINGYIRLGQYVPHDSVDISFLVSLEEGRDLAKATIRNFENKSVVEATVQLRELAAKLYRGEDEEHNASLGPLKWMPTFMIRPLVFVTGGLTLGISVKALGLRAFPFGSCIITNVGVFGLDEGFVPPTPFARVPIYVLIGAVRDGVTVVDGTLHPQKQLTLTATIDHRFMDGSSGGTLAKVIRGVFANPWSLDGLEGPPA